MLGVRPPREIRDVSKRLLYEIDPDCPKCLLEDDYKKEEIKPINLNFILITFIILGAIIIPIFCS